MCFINTHLCYLAIALGQSAVDQFILPIFLDQIVISTNLSITVRQPQSGAKTIVKLSSEYFHPFIIIDEYSSDVTCLK